MLAKNEWPHVKVTSDIQWSGYPIDANSCSSFSLIASTCFKVFPCCPSSCAVSSRCMPEISVSSFPGRRESFLWPSLLLPASSENASSSAPASRACLHHHHSTFCLLTLVWCDTMHACLMSCTVSVMLQSDAECQQNSERRAVSKAPHHKLLPSCEIVRRLQQSSTPSVYSSDLNELLQEGCCTHGHQPLISCPGFRIFHSVCWMGIAYLVNHHCQLLPHQAQPCQQLPVHQPTDGHLCLHAGRSLDR